MGILKNPRHEAFARHYVKLGVARQAYAKAGYQSRMPVRGNDSAPVDACASRLLKQAKVEKRIKEVRAIMSKRADVTEDSLIEELEQARLIAASEKQTGSMVAATMGKAKLAGLLVDRKEIGEAGDFAKMNEEQLRNAINEIENKIKPAPIPTNKGTESVQ